MRQGEEAFRRQVAKALELHFQALSMRAGRGVECDIRR
jgi:hypothetical protein